MSYSVTWSPDSWKSFLWIWGSSSDPLSVRRARDEINEMLSTTPDIGVLLADGLWFLEHKSLRIHYELDDSLRKVDIVSVNPTDI